MSRVNQVRVALVGYQPGDRVVVFQDTGSMLRGAHNNTHNNVESFPRAGVVLDPVELNVPAGNVRAGCLLVWLDYPPHDNGFVKGWWVLPRDLRPE